MHKLGQASTGDKASTRDNDVKLMLKCALSGFKPATHGSSVQHTTSGLPGSAFASEKVFLIADHFQIGK